MKRLEDLNLTDLGLDIFQYWDIQSLLKQYFKVCQQQDRRYSFRHFSKRLGLNSPGYIQLILKGEKAISDRLVERLIQLMDLRQSEREYFEILVRLSKLDFSSPLYQEYYDAMQAMRRKKLKVKTLNEAQCECVASWYHWVIREMATLRGARLKVQWFRRVLSPYVPISGKQIMQIVQDLREAKLLEGSDQDIVLPDPILNIEDETVSTALKHYHKGNLEQGILSLSNQAKDREYGSVLVSTTPEKLSLVKEKLRKVRREILETLDTPAGKASALVSFSYQLFPVAEVTDEDETPHSK